MSSLPIASPEFCARKFQVLADATRLAVLRCLMDGPKRVKDINALVPVEQSLLSHHLRTLRQEGFVRSRRDGKAMLYELVTPLLNPQVNPQQLDLQCCSISFDQL